MPPGKIIAISGFAGSGKNTVGEKVALALGWKVVSPTFKDLASDAGVSLMEFQERAKKDLSIDYKFDAALARKAAGGSCVIVTWIGPWIGEISGRKYGEVEIPAVSPDVFSVWLDAPSQLRAKRLAGREGISAEDAGKHIEKRDDDNVKRYKKAYGINIEEHEGFGMVLPVAEGDSPSILAAKIIAEAKRKGIIQ